MNETIGRSSSIAVTILLFLSLVLLDIVVVESFFRPSSLWGTIWVWNIAYLTVILVATIAVAGWTRSHLPLYALVLFAFGLEDTAFYSLQLKAPAYYVGVSILGIWEPQRNLVLTLNLLGLALVAVIELFYQRISQSLRETITPAKTNTSSRSRKESHPL
jgi:hypothetical protein